MNGFSSDNGVSFSMMDAKVTTSLSDISNGDLF